MIVQKSQSYIGTPNGVVLCVDRIADQTLRGRIYHGYSARGITFRSVNDAVFKLEQLYNDLNFPHPTTNDRIFKHGKLLGRKRNERTRIMKDEELLRKHGDLGSFIIRVQRRQNSSWQGRLTWVEKDETLNFRSVWEMVKLIESALNSVSEPADRLEEQTWSQAEEKESEKE